MLKKNIKKAKSFIQRLNGIAERKMMTNSTFDELYQIAHRESARYITQHLQKAILFRNDLDYWKYIFSYLPKNGFIMEFGVFEGRTINYYSELLQNANDKRIIYGFDSFEGFSEEWGGTPLTKDFFSIAGKMPQVNENVRLIKGWVEETFPLFIRDNIKENDRIAYLHLDVDTYTPTRCALKNSFPYFQVGTILDFDELLGYAGWREGEFKALTEVLDGNCKYEYIAFWENQRSADPVVKGALRITEI